MSIRILLLEDDAADAELLMSHLHDDAGMYVVQHVATCDEFVNALQYGGIDVVVADDRCAASSGTDPFLLLREHDAQLPFILLADHIGDEAVAAAMLSGVQDCILKDQLTKLKPAILREHKAAAAKRQTLRAKQRREETDLLYRTLITQMTDGVLLLLKGRIRFVNPPLATMLGYSDEDFRSIDITDIFNESDAAILSAPRSVAEHRRKHRMQLRKSDGSSLLADVTTSIITHCGNEGLLFTIHDLTRDIDVRRNIAQYAFIAESVREFVIMSDADGKITYCNAVALEQLCAADTLQSDRSVDSILPLDQSGESLRTILDRVSTREPWQCDLRIDREDKHSLWLSVTASVLHAETEYIGHVWIGRDITERIRQEASIRQSEENFRGLTEQSLVGVYVIQDFRFTYVNPMFAEIFQRSVEEILALDSISVLVHPDDRALVAGNVDQRMRGEVPRLRYGFRALQKDGTVRNVEVIGSITTFQGETAIIGTLIDITDHTKAEQDLIAAKELAERSDRLKDAFIANISHEIRTPLNIIMGYSSLARTELDEVINDQQAEYFGSMQRAGDRLMRTVELILNLASIQAGTFTVRKELLDVSALLERVHADLHAIADVRELSFSLELETVAVRINADRYCLEQAFINVIENALKFTREGGVSLRLWVDGDAEAIIMVTDTGIGIDEEFIPKLFDPFSQESLGLGRPFEGLGLGLALTRQYIAVNGGSVSVTSEKHRGTEVQMRFPLAADESAV